MNELHDILRLIVVEHGADTLASRQLVNIFNDIAPQHIRQRYCRVLRQSVNDRIGQELLNTLQHRDQAYRQIQLERLINSFATQNCYRDGFADYLINSFLYALRQLEHAPQPFRMPDPDECDDSDYLGQRRQNMRWGVGCHLEPDRDAYAGQWRMDSRHGVGVLISRNGTRYAGQWSGGKRQGRGIVVLPTGESYVATFRRNEISNESQGVFFTHDGSLVIGKMGENGPEGPCMRISPAGTITREDWHNGRPI